MNVDPQELEKFSKLAHRWWDPQGEFRPLHEINPLRLEWIDRAAGLAGKRVLDVGCGGGILAEAMAGRGARVTGIDLAEKPLRVAELHLLQSKAQVTYEQVSTDEYAARHAAEFDVVTCMELLEHVPDPASIISACAALAKPGGVVVVSTINRNPKAYALAILGAEYVLRMLPRGTHDYAKFLTPAELAAFARRAGLDVAGIIGLTYNPFAKTFRLATDTDVNYMMAFRRPVDE
jgi:2-polyprenyl-6-hydroxyphenyl methylase/3-demethylubiquinone-9 3-methyltransferase